LPDGERKEDPMPEFVVTLTRNDTLRMSADITMVATT
jgi:hypothetical protein